MIPRLRDSSGYGGHGAPHRMVQGGGANGGRRRVSLAACFDVLQQVLDMGLKGGMAGMKNGTYIVATDLGAESGRVVLCRWTGAEGILEEVHRFPNGARQEAGHLVWDLDRLWQEVLKGMRLAVDRKSVV